MSDSKRIGRPVNPNSLKALSVALFAQMKSEGKTSKEIKHAFQDILGVTAGTAQVYYHYANKSKENVSPKNENIINQSEPEQVLITA